LFFGGDMRKRNTTLLIILVLAFSFSAALVMGSDDEGNPNDPFTNDRANACYEDGTMASKCDTEWEWICGWYMIRFDAGIFTREEIPATCRVLLPGEPETVVNPATWPPAGCYYSSVYDLYIFWNGNQTQNPPIEMTYDGTCATPPHTGVGGFFLVSAANPSNAAAICTANGYNYVGEISSSADTGAWAIYRCQIP
jgi:hypothetical protein